MKRGLVQLDPGEVRVGEWTDRVRTLQRWLAGQGVSVALIYGDVHRSDDIGYLTNLCIYWNEGILAVPVSGDPVFLTKLSPRVHTWMRATSKVADLRSGKAFGPLVRGLLGEHEPGVIGIVDRWLWPAALLAEVSEACPGWAARPLNDAVRTQRLVPSTAELTMLRVAAAAMRRAFDEATAPGLSDMDRVAVLERGMRGSGYLDVLGATSTGADGSCYVETTGQYRNNWLRLAGPVRPATGAAAERLAGASRVALASVAPGATSEKLTAAVTAALPGGTTATVTCVNQADLSTGGEYAADRPVPEGAVVAIGVQLWQFDGARAVAAETVLVTADGPEILTGQEKEHTR